jgi:hypothetical protein
VSGLRQGRVVLYMRTLLAEGLAGRAEPGPAGAVI